MTTSQPITKLTRIGVYVEQHRSSPTHWSEESDHENEIEINEKIEQALFKGESEDELDDKN